MPITGNTADTEKQARELMDELLDGGLDSVARALDRMIDAAYERQADACKVAAREFMDAIADGEDVDTIALVSAVGEAS